MGAKERLIGRRFEYAGRLVSHARQRLDCPESRIRLSPVLGIVKRQIRIAVVVVDGESRRAPAGQNLAYERPVPVDADGKKLPILCAARRAHAGHHRPVPFL